jgi:hypothetical protein
MIVIIMVANLFKNNEVVHATRNMNRGISMEPISFHRKLDVCSLLRNEIAN